MPTQSMFTGLSAFPLTPVGETGIDDVAFTRLIGRLADAKVNLIGALGSTGSYAYLNRTERAHVARVAVEHAGDVPVMIGIGALRTRDVLLHAEDAQAAGASAVLLAPMSYLKLTDDEVYELYKTVCRSLSVPLCVYDNPGTTHFEFSDELHGRIAQLPQVASIKIPGVPAGSFAAKVRVDRLRDLIPARVTIGVSGDAVGATGLIAGCDVWYSVIGGLFPKAISAIVVAAHSAMLEEAERLSARLEPVWDLFRRYGSIRVVATAAELLGVVDRPSLPLPLRTLDDEERVHVAAALKQAGLTG